MMTVRLIAHTPEPEKVVAAAAKLCYSDAHIPDLLDGLDEEKTARFLEMLSDLGHASPIEHASFTFGIEGSAARCWHRSPATALRPSAYRASAMCVWMTSAMWCPLKIEAVPAAKQAFLESMQEDARRYLDLVEKLEQSHTQRLMEEGLPEKQARAKAAKAGQ